MSDFILEKATYHYFASLSEREKGLYKRFLYVLLNMEVGTDISEVFSREQVKKVSRAVINDRPDIFWYRGDYTTTSRNNVIIRIEFDYVYSKIQKDNMVRQIENSPLYRLINSELKAQKSDFEKALRLYELIIKNTDYEVKAISVGGDYYEYAYGLEGVLLHHRAVCSGYAKTYQYFMSKHNVLCTIVNGQTKKERHSWNLINLYGDYYYVDTTWGDPVFSNQANADPNYISYEYFCITTRELEESHRPILDYPMPLCTATKYNYFRYFGLLESKYSVEGIANRIISAVRNRKSEVVIKFTSQMEYQKAVVGLFEKSEIFVAFDLAAKYVNGLKINKVNYSTKNNTKMISIKL